MVAERRVEVPAEALGLEPHDRPPVRVDAQRGHAGGRAHGAVVPLGVVLGAAVVDDVRGERICTSGRGARGSPAASAEQRRLGPRERPPFTRVAHGGSPRRRCEGGRAGRGVGRGGVRPEPPATGGVSPWPPPCSVPTYSSHGHGSSSAADRASHGTVFEMSVKRMSLWLPVHVARPRMSASLISLQLTNEIAEMLLRFGAAGVVGMRAHAAPRAIRDTRGRPLTIHVRPTPPESGR